ncbi:NAD(P)-linked oxidoreductase superfamily protein [Artemisia annua]|uniref:NAD(P)-linked oxidoreductase superfamily protein n=1 Tax=Artemisia annua TaxID=35608 RepID=A0A2U1LWQ7_ARTAN|nr:NAD(P)-linked oxidoreductase superfamily protein [Artemisia annua]
MDEVGYIYSSAFSRLEKNDRTLSAHIESNSIYGTVMGGLLSEKLLDTNLSIPFAGPLLNTPSLQKYKRMVDAWGGRSLFQALLKTLNQVVVKHGVSIPSIVVKFILDQGQWWMLDLGY